MAAWSAATAASSAGPSRADRSRSAPPPSSAPAASCSGRGRCVHRRGRPGRGRAGRRLIERRLVGPRVDLRQQSALLDHLSLREGDLDDAGRLPADGPSRSRAASRCPAHRSPRAHRPSTPWRCSPAAARPSSRQRTAVSPAAVSRWWITHATRPIEHDQPDDPGIAGGGRPRANAVGRAAVDSRSTVDVRWRQESCGVSKLRPRAAPSVPARRVPSMDPPAFRRAGNLSRTVNELQRPTNVND